jgi:hypothetical protein
MQGQKQGEQVTDQLTRLCTDCAHVVKSDGKLAIASSEWWRCADTRSINPVDGLEKMRFCATERMFPGAGCGPEGRYWTSTEKAAQ